MRLRLACRGCCCDGQHVVEISEGEVSMSKVLSEYLNATEAAAHCRIGRSTFYKLVSEGLGPHCIRLNYRKRPLTRYRRTDLDVWMQSFLTAPQRDDGDVRQ